MYGEVILRPILSQPSLCSMIAVTYGNLGISVK